MSAEDPPKWAGYHDDDKYVGIDCSRWVDVSHPRCAEMGAKAITLHETDRV
jgi:hypothetical protein